MAILLPSLLKSCSGGHGISSKEEDRRSALHIRKKKGGMTMATFFLPQ